MAGRVRSMRPSPGESRGEGQRWGKLVACGTCEMRGSQYAGAVKGGKAHGHGTLVHASGGIYRGEFVMGRRSGSGMWLAADGSWYAGEWINDVEHGFGIKCFGAMHMEGEFRDGQFFEEAPSDAQNASTAARNVAKDADINASRAVEECCLKSGFSCVVDDGLAGAAPEACRLRILPGVLELRRDRGRGFSATGLKIKRKFQTRNVELNDELNIAIQNVHTVVIDNSQLTIIVEPCMAETLAVVLRARVSQRCESYIAKCIFDEYMLQQHGADDVNEAGPAAVTTHASGTSPMGLEGLADVIALHEQELDEARREIGLQESNRVSFAKVRDYIGASRAKLLRDQAKQRVQELEEVLPSLHEDLNSLGKRQGVLRSKVISTIEDSLITLQRKLRVATEEEHAHVEHEDYDAAATAVAEVERLQDEISKLETYKLRAYDCDDVDGSMNEGGRHSGAAELNELNVSDGERRSTSDNRGRVTGGDCSRGRGPRDDPVMPSGSSD